jgi:hypothetical protein
MSLTFDLWHEGLAVPKAESMTVVVGTASLKETMTMEDQSWT